jgi:hypothetical protein
LVGAVLLIFGFRESGLATPLSLIAFLVHDTQRLWPKFERGVL